ncbi:unnamed protein product [Rhizophagus irregularis]|nr:unnamed protein product [Rhizophagus irregularis]CAB5392834.1 unnamed protein product [Rhizophagus irregularis]
MEFINAPIEHNNLTVKSHPKAYYTSHLLDFTSKELNEILEGSQELKSFELEQKNDDAEKQFHKLEKIAEIYQSSQSSQNELREIQIYYKQIEEENLDLQQRNFNFEQYNQKLRLELATQIKEFAKKENIFQTQIINLQNEKQSLASNLTEQLKQNNLINQQVQTQISQLEQEKIDLHEKLTQTEANIQELKSQKENLIKQKKQLEIKLNQIQVNYEQIEQEKIRLHDVVIGLSQEHKLTIKLKVKLEREIAQLEQKLNNEKQIEIQLTQALQIKEDKVDESEQRLINLDYERIKKLKKEMNEIDKKLLIILSSGKNTNKIHKEKEVKQKEMEEFKQELSRTSASYNTNRKKWVFKQVNNFLKAKNDFLTLQEKAIKKLQNCCNHLESSINKERNTIGSTRSVKTSELVDKYTKEFQNILLKYNDVLLELKLNKKFSSLKKIVQENKELKECLMIENILKLNSYNLDKYKIFKFATNSKKGTRIQLNSNMMAEDINSLRKNFDELKLELKQETKGLKNLAGNEIQPY